MDNLINILIGYGYWGMLMSAFLAGSFFPFSSEVVMVALSAAGLNSGKWIVFGTIGTVLGGAFNYVIGRMGKMVWIEKYLHVSQKNLDKAEKFMGGHGALMGFFAFLPILGSAITIVLGLTRANIPLSLISVTLGKFLRYVILIYGANLLIS